MRIEKWEWAFFALIFFLVSLSLKPAISATIKSPKPASVGFVPQVDKSLLTRTLVNDFEKNHDKDQLVKLRNEVLKNGPKSVPALIEVMKNDKFPEKNRWVATFLLGKIMGKKSSPFVAKFLEHPNWLLRLASLKTLLHLRETKYSKKFAEALKDDSLIVRTQALDNIRELKLADYSPHVWSMLYDKKNYTFSEKKLKRTHIIKKAIRTIGDLGFDKAKDPLFKMAQKNKYKDIFSDIDYTLAKLTGSSSPNGGDELKKIFWKKEEAKVKVL